MGIKIIVRNKKASYDYFLMEKFEAGIVLQGTEAKSLRGGKVSIAESFIFVDRNNEIWANNIYIPVYEFGNINNHEERRKRKLLLHHKEIAKIKHRMSAESLTLIPTIIYFKNSYVKIEISLARGKKRHDKRQDQAKKDVERKLQRGQYD